MVEIICALFCALLVALKCSKLFLTPVHRGISIDKPTIITRNTRKTSELQVVHPLPQKSGNFGWNVNGKPILDFPNETFPEKTGFLER